MKFCFVFEFRFLKLFLPSTNLFLNTNRRLYKKNISLLTLANQEVRNEKLSHLIDTIDKVNDDEEEVNDNKMLALLTERISQIEIDSDL